MIINGKTIARTLVEELKTLPNKRKMLHVIVVGKDPATLSFITEKQRIAQELDIEFQVHSFPERAKEEDLRREIASLAEKKLCGGIIIQLPLPSHLNKQYLLNSIPREKDVDVLSERALGAFYTGRSNILPPSVATLLQIVDSTFVHSNGDEQEIAKWFFENKKVAVVGLGLLVGKPIATWLLGKCPEIFFLDKGSNMSLLKEMDVIISGVGESGLINASMLKPDACVIDFGYSKKGTQLRGDFDARECPETLHYTPTPGGTGPVLVAEIFKNFLLLNK